MPACSHFSSINLNPPIATSKVFKDECVLCFDSPDLEEGIDICLSCFQGNCLKTHGILHFQKSGHSLVMNLRRIKKVTERKAKKITKLEIKEENEANLHDLYSKVKCLACGGIEIDMNQGNLKSVVDGILNAASAKKQSEIKAWEQELTSCYHSNTLIQPQQNCSVPFSKCNDCDLTNNLWLCLSCGNLGCGRQQFGGTGGNGHAMDHFQTTGHPMCVKLGTITPDGTADIFCYACGEERINPKLAEHLAKFSINVQHQQKTEKSLTEMQIEKNLKFDFSMTTEDGKQMEPVYGPGLTGLKNLGNSCYMASSLQCIFGLEPFQKRFFKELINHPEYCPDRAFDCFLCQTVKLADGLLSGRYSVPQEVLASTPTGVDGDELQKNVSQKGIAPSMFKYILGKDHAEFSTMRQQDANEFIDYFLKIAYQQDTDRKKSPVNHINFQTEQRLQCLECERVKYTSVNETFLSLFVPAKKKPAEQWSSLEKASDDDIYETVGFESCVDRYFESSFNEGYSCPQCQHKSTLTSTVRIRTYPSILMIVMKRFIVDENYVMKKLNLKINAPSTLDLLNYQAKGQQPDEVLLPESTTDNGPTSPAVDQESLNQLLQMGFPEVRCVKALVKTGNSGADVAMTWLFEHMDDPDIDEPLVMEFSNGSNRGSSGNEFPEGEISMLTDMGFTVDQAKRALQHTQGNMERAVDWLFSHADDPIDDILPDASNETNSTQQEEAIEPVSSATYELISFISHRGTSAACGHYVAHVKKGDHWVLFNDEKVVEVPIIEDATGEGYVYFYVKK